jgi:hypothetical protein
VDGLDPLPAFAQDPLLGEQLLVRQIRDINGRGQSPRSFLLPLARLDGNLL